MNTGDSWSVLHNDQIEHQMKQKALDDAAEGRISPKGASHAKGQAVAVGVVLGAALLLLIVLKLI